MCHLSGNISIQSAFFKLLLFGLQVFPSSMDTFNKNRKKANNKVCPKCSRVFNRGTHMRNHLKTHDKERSKVICSVTNCEKEYSDIKAWMVHFNRDHQKLKKQFDMYKNNLEFKTVTNVVNQPLIENLLLENTRLKAQIQQILKIRCATKLRKRYVKFMRKKNI